MKKIILMLAVALIASSSMAATITWTGANSTAMGSGNNWSPDLGNVTVGAGYDMIVNSSATNIANISTNNDWIDSGTAVDGTDPVVGATKWGGASLSIGGTGATAGIVQLSTTKSLRVGEVGTGQIDILDDGTLQLYAISGAAATKTAELRIGGFDKDGVDWNGIGVVNVSGNGTITDTGAGAVNSAFVRLGESGSGTLNLSDNATLSLTNSNDGTADMGEALRMGANNIDTGTNNSRLQLTGSNLTVDIETITMNGGFTNTIAFVDEGTGISVINSTGGLAVTTYGWIELADFGAAAGVVDLIHSDVAFTNAAGLYANNVGTSSGWTLQVVSDGAGGEILQAVPEPATMLLLGLGGVLLRRRRA